MESRFRKTEGIILSSVSFGEGHKIINIFTSCLGKIEASAFGVRKTKSRFGSKLEPFTHARLILYRKSEESIFTISDAEAISHNRSIREDFHKFVVGSAIIEPVVRFVEGGSTEVKLFRLLAESLKILNEIADKKAVFLLSIYELKFLSLMGYTQQIESCIRCGKTISGASIYMDPRFGFPVCEACKTELSKEVYPSTIKFVDWAQDNPLKHASRVTMSEKTLVNVRDLIERLYGSIFNRGLESWKQLAI